jgi:hypothetical protein
MGFFSKILEKLGIKKEQPVEAAGKAPIGASGGAGKKEDPKFVPTKDFHPTGAAGDNTGGRAIPEVDVVKQLEEKAKGSPGLDWKVSIVDLLKLLDIDSSREARNELAKELGATEDVMSDSAKMNTWLHKEVLRRIAANGGNIPGNLLD